VNENNLALTKTGAGTLTLTGNSTQGGGTTVSGGRLAVNGSLTSNVTVNAGGNLGGSGKRRERVDDENVDVAVRQAGGVEVGVPEQGEDGRREQRPGVGGGDQRTGGRRAGAAAGVGEYQVDNEREREPANHHREAGDQRRPVLPGGPHRREPRESRNQRQVPVPARGGAEADH